MKKITLLMLCFSFVSSLSAQNEKVVVANDSLLNVNKFYLHIFSLANSKFKPSYEIINKEGRKSFLITPIFTQQSTEKVGVGIELQYRSNYRIKDAFTKFKKLYMAPYSFYEYVEQTNINYSSATTTTTTFTVKKQTDFISKYGLGFIFGTQFYLLEDRFVIDAYLGGGIQRSDVNINSGTDYSQDITYEGFSGVTIRGGLQVGFVF